VLEFRILGPLEVVRDGEPVELSAPRLRTTLAILLLNANRVVSVDELADALYAGEPPVTAVTQVQRRISELRKLLGGAAGIETRPPGYVLQLAPGQLDLHHFERLSAEAANVDSGRAAELLREALSLWRGTPLADLAYEVFAQAALARLYELRLDALERRLDADLSLGRHGAVVAELEELVAKEPHRERVAGQLMLALYRCGRQADALATYRRARTALVRDLGLEPTPALRELEAAILRQDPLLEKEAQEPAGARAILAAARTEAGLEPLLGVAVPLARRPGRELILARLVEDEADVTAAAAAVNAHRAGLDAQVRAAAFTSQELAGDLVRLGEAYDVDLVLLDGTSDPPSPRVADELAELFTRSTADVAIVFAKRRAGSGGVFVPFGGGQHDWAAAELGAWLALGLNSRLTLVGTRADLARGRRDASRLLADASLAVQQVAGVETAPLLAEPTEQGLLEAAGDAGIVVAGVPERWRKHGIGGVRGALIAAARQPVVLVHRGLRPGGLAPRESATRFTWSLDPYLQAVSLAPT
jgi:DNA-binding SARP family transcriptional activator